MPAIKAPVRAFPDLLASVRGYMFNLNSFYAYDEFRRYRAAYFDDKVSFDIMVGHLRAYAETGGEYVGVIKKVISQNQFNRFDEVQLKPPIY